MTTVLHFPQELTVGGLVGHILFFIYLYGCFWGSFITLDDSSSSFVILSLTGTLDISTCDRFST